MAGVQNSADRSSPQLGNDAAPLRALRTLCRIAPAEGAMLVRFDPEPGAFRISASTWPLSDTSPPAWVMHAVREARAGGGGQEGGSPQARAFTAEMSADDGREAGHIGPMMVAAVPLTNGPGAEHRSSNGEWWAVFLLRAGSAQLPSILPRLELAEDLLRAQSARDEQDRLRRVLEPIAALGGRRRLREAGSGFCEQLAGVTRSERVSLGLCRDGGVRLVVSSHAERIVRSTAAARLIEAAMEEALDEDEAVMHPPVESSAAITRAAGELARQGAAGGAAGTGGTGGAGGAGGEGPGGAVVSLIIRDADGPIGVVTLERGAAGGRFSPEEIEDLRLTTDLASGPLRVLGDFGESFWRAQWSYARGWAGAVVGPRHVGAKLGVLALVVVAALVILVPGTLRVSARCEILTPMIDIFVPDDRVRHVRIGQVGFFTPASDPGVRAEFAVESIADTAEVLDGRVVVRVSARLRGPPEGLIVGGRGIARIDAGRRPLAQLWFGPIVDWWRLHGW